MEIGSRYKQTEVGMIPEDWDVKELFEIGSFKKGKGIRKDELVSDGLPCVRYGELYTVHHEYIKRFYSFVRLETAKESQKINKGDLLFAGSGETKEEIGKCAAFLDNKEAYAGGDVIILSPKNCSSHFLGFLLNHEIVVKQKVQMAQGDAVVHIYPNNLANILIPLPPTEAEQNAIAQAISDVDALIQSLEKLIAKKCLVRQGAMQELLTGKRRLPGFEKQKGYKQTELGLIPEDWDLKNIPEIVIKKDGIKIGPFGSQLKKQVLVDQGYKVYGQENIFKQNMKIGDRFITEEHFNKLKTCELVAGDFIISMMGTIGKCMIVPKKIEPGIMDSHLLRLKLNSKVISPNLLLHFFSSELLINQVSKYSVGGIMDGLSSTIIKKIQVSLPPTEIEQTAISTILTDMKTEISTLETKLAKYKQIKQGMAQNLLTGRIRLI